MDINRRPLVKGLVWSMPAVAVASSAPAFATSEPPESTYCTPSFCKEPGENRGKNYRIEFTCSSKDVLPATVYITFYTGSDHRTVEAEREPDSLVWYVRNRPDSHTPAKVTVVYADGHTEEYDVKFLPCHRSS